MLYGKNVVITGGTSGIGYEIAKEAISLGAKVLITGRNAEKLREIKKVLKCEILEWDISNPELAKEKIKNIIEIMNGKVDCFVNNAGIFKYSPYNDCIIEDWNILIDTNLKGLFFATREIITQCFEKSNTGNIIMISSIEGIRCENGDSPYAISKAGVNHLAKSLAKKLLNKNIRVNAIAPGVTCSNISKVKDEDNLYREYAKSKRILTAKEIADVAMFLISDSSKCITGQIIACDNGETIL